MPKGEHLRGRKLGGRAKGTPNKSTTAFADRLEQMGCVPEEIMALIAVNKLPCGVCRGKLRTAVYLGPGSHASGCKAAKRTHVGDCPQCANRTERLCQSCHGSGLETCEPKLRGDMASELMCYRLPKRKAVEVTGAEGGDMGVKLVIEYVTEK